MSPLSPINPLQAGAAARSDAPLPKISLPSAQPAVGPAAGFGALLDGVAANVVTKQQDASALARSVLLGDTDQLHQSVIAMQEAGVAFSLMVEVRNKLVESYQELMRMQV